MLFIFSACTPSYEIKSDYDEFTKTERVRMKSNSLKTDNTISGIPYLELNLCKLKRQNTIKFYIHIYYANSDWLFIEEGKSLIFLIDDNKYELYGTGSSGYRNVYTGPYGHGIYEEAYYDCNINFIHHIINAKIVKVRLNGSSYVSSTFVMTQDNIKHFNDFINQY